MEKLTDIIQKQGIHLFNIIEPCNYPEIEKRYKNWIANNYHGSMKYLEENISLKVNPAKLLPGCRSMIIVGLNYNLQEKNNIKKTYGRISKYARVRDYHKVLGKKLKNVSRWIETTFPGTVSKSFTDAVPLLESHYAVAGKLGFKGKNSLVINPEYGSRFFIGEILTTKHFPAIQNAKHKLLLAKEKKCSDNCKFCIKSCPTGAIVSPYVINASKCISYLTIEYDGIIPVPLRNKMCDWIFGCDICQDVCPYNIDKIETEEPDFKKYLTDPALDLRTILEIKNDQEFLKLFAGTSLMRAKRIKLLRNATIAAANNKLYELLPLLKKLKTDKNSIIQEHAAWAVKQLER